MKIKFDKVGQTAKPFRVEIGSAVLTGTLQKSGYHLVSLQGNLEGKTELSCDRCGAPIEYPLAYPLKLTISDRIVEDKDDLDIIEFLDGEIDISYILQSELNTLKSEYHYCDACENGDEEFEMKF